MRAFFARIPWSCRSPPLLPRPRRRRSRRRRRQRSAGAVPTELTSRASALRVALRKKRALGWLAGRLAGSAGCLAGELHPVERVATRSVAFA